MTEAVIDAVRDALRGVADPEAGIDIVELGLIYAIVIDGDTLRIDMTTTSPACPSASLLFDSARAAAAKAADGYRVELREVWDPLWEPDRMSEAAKRRLGW